MIETILPVNTIDQYVPSANKPWDAQRVRHLYNRLGYGASLNQVTEGLNLDPDELVDQLIDTVLNAPNPTPFPWSYWTSADYTDQDEYFEHKSDFRIRWLSEMSTNPIQSKLSLFWHNHFVTQEDVYFCNSSMWAYYDLIQKNVLGNFRTFVEAMGKNPAMLVFLNGNQNVAGEPNENYGRELMELFTMGENNGYTQNDIVEVARALTGWRFNMYDCDANTYFQPNLYDDTNKTIFGQSGAWNYDDVHELIFTLRAEQTATYICSKIYRHFVYEQVDATIVGAMAQTFQDNNWELAPVFRQLFKSEHFFEERYVNAHVKSPFESFFTLFNGMDLTYPTDLENGFLNTVWFWSFEMGQELFNPVDVAGWPGHKAWINENTLTARWGFMQSILYNEFFYNDGIRTKMRDLAIALTSELETDPVVISAAFVEHFLNTTLDSTNLQTATQYFIGEIPANYFEDGTWNLYYDEVPDQVFNLLLYLTKLPEWQLS